MLGQLDLGSEEGEDGLMKVMQGMMATLLSRDVLYPSLTDLCKQVYILQEQSSCVVVIVPRASS